MKNLLTRYAAAAFLAFFVLWPPQAHAQGIPVIDASSLAQIITQGLQQIQQYQTQLQQYANQLQNTATPPSYIWDQAVNTMTQLKNSIDTLSGYTSSYGSLNSYLNNFQATSSYQSSPCFSSTGCTQAQWGALETQQRFGSQVQKDTLDAEIKGLVQQQNALITDANTLQNLQTGAQSATGQMQAIQYANQLASNQANQLLQIRALLVAQQNAQAARAQVVADREAQEDAAHAVAIEARGPTTLPSNTPGW
ncbi:MAG: P-type conjugative transfer protein TrbJ [Alphaproteobacteria bacterium]|nr:P-type conjugative transfer protein TrbJ [Alphaproteobacteria bacterium]